MSKLIATAEGQLATSRRQHQKGEEKKKKKPLGGKLQSIRVMQKVSLYSTTLAQYRRPARTRARACRHRRTAMA